MQGWLKVKSAAAYADCGDRLLRDWLKQGLRYVKYHGTIRIKPEWIDGFLMQHEVLENQVDTLVDEVCKGLLEG